MHLYTATAFQSDAMNKPTCQDCSEDVEVGKIQTKCIRITTQNMIAMEILFRNMTGIGKYSYIYSRDFRHVHEWLQSQLKSQFLTSHSSSVVMYRKTYSYLTWRRKIFQMCCSPPQTYVHMDTHV